MNSDVINIFTREPIEQETCVVRESEEFWYNHVDFQGFKGTYKEYYEALLEFAQSLAETNVELLAIIDRQEAQLKRSNDEVLALKALRKIG